MKKLTGAGIVILLSVLLVLGVANASPTAAPTASMDPALTAILNSKSDQPISVIVTLNDQVDVTRIYGRDFAERQRLVAQALRAKADSTQSGLRALLAQRQAQGSVGKFTPLWIVNSIAVTADSAVIAEIAHLPYVRRIALDATITAPSPVTQSTTTASPEPNISLINAPALWSLGYVGQGVVVASMDTGVDMSHTDIAAQWRGGADSWYDPYGQHSSPTDVNGHGTWAMSIIVGGSNGGTAIGVAPQAKWIAAKIFNDSNTSMLSAIHQAYQWVLDPDGNPLTPDAPNVVNNSWSFNSIGCNLEFEPDLQSLVAAGITPVFAAGNFGPNISTDASPGNNPDAFAVGATDNTDAIASFSSRGPTSCGRSAQTTYPAVVAPGVNIKVDDLYGLYNNVSGTSFSAPHVSGGLALLLNAFPTLTVAQQETALAFTAKDLGTAGPDNTFGAGRIDLLAAYNAIASGSVPTPTPTPLPPPPTSTPLPPTATSTPMPPTSTPTPTPIPNAIFSDGFESGSFSAWSSSTGAGTRINVTTAAKQAGVYGMAAQISSGTSGYVVDNSPNNETSYHARFYFSPNGAAPGSTAQDIFLGLNAFNTNVFRVQMRMSGKQYQIGVTVARSGGTTSTKWYTITNAYHAIEIAFQSAGSASFTLYIDGAAQQTLTGLNTSAYTIKSVRLGPQGTLSGVSGTEYFDTFASTRTTYIGP